MPLRVSQPDAKQLQRLLPGLPPNAIAEVAASARQVTYRAGETIMGENGRWVPAVVADGTIRLTIRSHDGREATLRQVGRGVVVGLIALFQPEYSNPSPERSMVAVERSTLVFLNPALVSQLILQHPEFTMNIVRGLIEWGGALSDAAGRFAFMSVRQRVATHLVGIAVQDAAGSRWVASITQQQLADAVGSVREVVARTLHDMRADGLISVARARVTVVDRDGLSRLATDVT